MAKNDFFPIVYRILAALYKNLKEDKKNDGEIFEKELYDVTQHFLDYILKYIIDEKFIMYASYRYFGSEKHFFGLENSVITPKGIEYIEENSLMQKTKMFLKDIKESIPFI